MWADRASFALDVAAGAPPDSFFTSGQNWGFAPLHAERIRENGYAYLRACLDHHLRAASVLRIDHVMSLHRLFCIPSGMETRDGVYVRYRAEEMYAVLALASARHRSVLVGEDLGLVPPAVRPAMRGGISAFLQSPSVRAAALAPAFGTGRGTLRAPQPRKSSR